jgi:hypothetical protein
MIDFILVLKLSERQNLVADSSDDKNAMEEECRDLGDLFIFLGRNGEDRR